MSIRSTTREQRELTFAEDEEPELDASSFFLHEGGEPRPASSDGEENVGVFANDGVPQAEGAERADAGHAHGDEEGEEGRGARDAQQEALERREGCFDERGGVEEEDGEAEDGKIDGHGDFEPALYIRVCMHVCLRERGVKILTLERST